MSACRRAHQRRRREKRRKRKFFEQKRICLRRVRRFVLLVGASKQTQNPQARRPQQMEVRVRILQHKISVQEPFRNAHQLAAPERS